MKKFLMAVLMIFLSTGVGVLCAQEIRTKAVFLIAQKDFQDDEFSRPRAILEAEGVEVTVASSTLAEVTGMNGMKTVPQLLYTDVKVENYDAVVFIGGSGTTQYINDPVAHRLAREAVEKNKVIGAICLAPRVLASAGLLKDKRATVYPSEGESLKQSGALYTAKPVEQDGNIITADGPDSADAFGVALLKQLKGRGK